MWPVRKPGEVCPIHSNLSVEFFQYWDWMNVFLRSDVDFCPGTGFWECLRGGQRFQKKSG